MSFWPVTKRVVKDSDVVVLIVDARLPELSQNEELERIVNYHGKVLIKAFNKIDLVDSKFAEQLREKYPDALFISGVKNLGMSKLKEAIYVSAKRRGVEEPKVGFVGYPNVGKSAVINALAKRDPEQKFLVWLARRDQWVRVGRILVLDSPGVIPIDDKSFKLGLIGAKNPEKMKLPEIPAYELIRMFIENGKLESLEKVYHVKLEGLEVEDILVEIGKYKGFLSKGGIVDERKTAIHILRDWVKGKLSFS